MRNIVLHMHMSLDGYIADSSGKIDWCRDKAGEAEFRKSVDTVIMGFAAYRQIVTELSPLHWPYPELQTYVVSKHPIPDYDSIHFRSRSELMLLLEQLRQEPGKDIWISGGAATAQTLADVIDRYHISLMPVLLGSGKRLFGERKQRISLKLVSSTTVNGIPQLIYERA